MKYLKYLYYFIVIVAVSILYEKYKKQNDTEDKEKNQELVKKYLLNENSYLGGKPILWIHNTLNINARDWPSFGSRNTKDLNQPYIYLCIQSIINKCSDSFNICLIDDESFSKLIPKWTINIDNVAEPIRSHLRTLALMKLLYHYGGMLCPNSFIAMKDFKDTYNNSLKNSDCFVGTFINRTNASINTFPSCRFMGCKKNSNCIKQFTQFLEILNSGDYTNTHEFLGIADRYLFKLSCENKITQISGKILGVIDKNNKILGIDELLSESYYTFDKECIGIYLPADEILKRFKYQWFPRLSHEQLINNNLTISKYFITNL
jgi:hypothetical protein